MNEYTILVQHHQRVAESQRHHHSIQPAIPSSLEEMGETSLTLSPLRRMLHTVQSTVTRVAAGAANQGTIKPSW